MAEIDELARMLGPLIAAQVTATIQQANATARTPQVASGTVTDILDSPDDDTVIVQMDDGGLPGDPLTGHIPALRMDNVAVDDRVRVHFFPRSGAEAHRVDVP